MGGVSYEYEYDTYKTIRLLEIGGSYFALQQRYRLYTMTSSRTASDAGVDMTIMPRDDHRLVELSEIVDLSSAAEKALAGEGVDDMKEL